MSFQKQTESQGVRCRPNSRASFRLCLPQRPGRSRRCPARALRWGGGRECNSERRLQLSQIISFCHCSVCIYRILLGASPPAKNISPNAFPEKNVFSKSFVLR